MRIVALLALFALGCGQPAGPQLRCVDFAADESANPMPFMLKVDNDGDDAQVDAIEMSMNTGTILGDMKAAPKTFRTTPVLLNQTEREGKVFPLDEGQSLSFPTGHRSLVWCALEWDVGRSPAPFMAIGSATFTLKYKGKVLLTTPEYTFAMQTQPGVIDSVIRDVGQDAESDAELIQMLKFHDGAASRQIRTLRKALESKYPPGPSLDAT